jgi:acetolactate synthase-1/2/3 large subunit
MKLSDYIINFLVSKNSVHVFEVCGGSITHLLDSLYKRKDIKVVSMHHEQAAAFAAEGYSRSGGNSIGVAMATSGPGATNMITGIASCFFDSIPCIFITGQVNTYEFKFNKPVRQVGFQETDIVNLVKPITKYAELVTEPDKIRYYLEKAFYMAKSGRPGPVLLDIPMNIQRAEINPKLLKPFCVEISNLCKKLNDSIIKKVIDSIKSSSRPVVLIGGGLRLSKAQDDLLKFIKHTGIPVVSSLMGIDGFPHDDQVFSGMIGTYGNRYANLTIANADLVLILGARLDTRQTGTKPETFARGANIIHVDIDRHELNNKRKADIPVNCDIKYFLTLINNKIGGYDKDKIELWRKSVKGYKKRYPSHHGFFSGRIDPNFFMSRLSEFLPKSAVVCADVGQNQMWAAQALKINKTQRFLTQGGAGAMGSSLAMAIGASFANPGKVIIAMSGDGGFQLNIQELQTIYHYKLPIKIMLLNNRCYGMVKQFQEQYFNSRFQSTVLGYSCPDFQSVISAYRIPVQRISRADKIDRALRKLFSNKRPGFLEIDIYPNIKVIPKLSVNRPVEDQEPLLSRDELKSNMFVGVLPKDKK